MRSNFFIIGIIIAAAAIFGSQVAGDHWQQLKEKIPALPEALQALLNKPADKITESTTTAYKWQDADGNWQFGDTPPPNSTYETTNISRVQSVEMHIPEEIKQQPAETETPQSTSPITPFTRPDKVKQLLDNARAIEPLLEQRKQAMDAQIDNP
ncbi:MAG: DUF4124 domain-containing protein [Gammaproteobacteria bacterium]|nr:DUF4124 domain-containing protein [Gammaproteobacteria bacterium]MCF6229711.1 DUF4124 domain-containing protein [Gammaproteobacteria bacterium]